MDKLVSDGGGEVWGQELLTQCDVVHVVPGEEHVDVFDELFFSRSVPGWSKTTSATDANQRQRGVPIPIFSMAGTTPDHHLNVGDNVRVVKEGSLSFGRSATVQVVDWNDQPGKYQVRIDSDGSIRSYEWFDLERMGTGYKSTKKDRAYVRDRINVQRYFYYQTKLYAALCQDRNYLAITPLQHTGERLCMSYPVLLAAIVSVDDLRLKNRLFRLVAALWIDTAPQSNIAVPMLTRGAPSSRRGFSRRRHQMARRERRKRRNRVRKRQRRQRNQRRRERERAEREETESVDADSRSVMSESSKANDYRVDVEDEDDLEESEYDTDHEEDGGDENNALIVTTMNAREAYDLTLPFVRRRFNRFALLQCIVKLQLRSMKLEQVQYAHELNKLTRSLVTIISSLADFGFYRSSVELEIVVSRVAKIMDNANDITWRTNHNALSTAPALPSSTSALARYHTWGSWNTKVHPVDTYKGRTPSHEIERLRDKQSAVSLETSLKASTERTRVRLTRLLDSNAYTAFILTAVLVSIPEAILRFSIYVGEVCTLIFTIDCLMRYLHLGHEEYFYDVICIVELVSTATAWFEYAFRASGSSALHVSSVAGYVALFVFLFMRLIRFSRIYFTNKTKRTDGIEALFRKIERDAKTVVDRDFASKTRSISKKKRESGFAEMASGKRAMVNLIKRVLVLRRDLWLKAFTDTAYEDPRAFSSTESVSSAAVRRIFRDVVSSDRFPFKPVQSDPIANVFLRLAVDMSQDVTSECVVTLIDAYRQRQYLRQNIVSSQVLTTSRELKMEVVRTKWLPMLVESIDRFEVWRKVQSRRSETRITNIEKGFAYLSALCYAKHDDVLDEVTETDEEEEEKEEEETLDDDDSHLRARRFRTRRYDPTMQRALLDLECHHLVRRVLSVPFSEIHIVRLDADKASSPRRRQRRTRRNPHFHKRMQESCNRFAIALMGGRHEKAQRVFKESVFDKNGDLSSEWCIRQLLDHHRLRHVPSCALVVKHIFDGQLEFAKDGMVLDMIKSIVGLLSECEPAKLIARHVSEKRSLRSSDARRLRMCRSLCEPLKALSIVNGIAIKENQIRIIRGMKNSEHVLVRFDDETFSSMRAKKTSRDAIAFVVNQLQLLGSCCQGRMNLAEATCQKVFSYELCLQHTISNETPWYVRMTLMYYFYHVYVESSVPVHDLTRSPSLATLITQMTAWIHHLESSEDGDVDRDLDVLISLEESSSAATDRPSPGFGYGGYHVLFLDDASASDDDEKVMIKRGYLLILIRHVVLPFLRTFVTRYKSSLTDLMYLTKKTRFSVWTAVAESSKAMVDANETMSNFAMNVKLSDSAFQSLKGIQNEMLRCRHVLSSIMRRKGNGGDEENEEDDETFDDLDDLDEIEGDDDDLLSSALDRGFDRSNRRGRATSSSLTAEKATPRARRGRTFGTPAFGGSGADHTLDVRFERIKQAVTINADVKRFADEEFERLIRLLFDFTTPRAFSDVQSVRFLRRLVKHVKGLVVRTSGDEKCEMGAKSTRIAENAVYLLLRLATCDHRRQIKSSSPVVPDPRDPSGHTRITLSSAEAAVWSAKCTEAMLTILLRVGTLDLCVSLCGHGLSRSLQESAIELANVLLEGLHEKARDKIAESLVAADSHHFYAGIHYMIMDSKILFSHHAADRQVNLGTLADDDPWSFKTLNFLRLLLDGHHDTNQRLLREQSQNTTSINLYDTIGEYLGEIITSPRLLLPSDEESDIGKRAYDVASAIFKVLREAVEGPNWVNQKLIASSMAPVLVSCRQWLEFAWSRLNAAETTSGEARFRTKEDMEESQSLHALIKSCALFLIGMLDGRLGADANDRLVRDAIVNDVDLTSLRGRLRDLRVSFLRSKTSSRFLQKELSNLKRGFSDIVEAVFDVVCRTSENSDLEETGIPAEAYLIGQLMSMLGARINDEDVRWLKLKRVRIVWKGRVEDMYFQTPEILRTVPIGERVEAFLFAEVNTTSTEKKLQQFVSFSKRIKDQVEWNEALRRYTLTSVFNARALHVAKVTSYWLVVLLNLTLVFASVYEEDRPFYSGDPALENRTIFWNWTLNSKLVIGVMAVLESWIAVYNVAYCAIVNMPTYLRRPGSNIVKYVFEDSMMLWYVTMAMLALCGMAWDYMFIPWLLLDHIPNDPALLNVVYAVSTVRTSLLKTFWLLVILLFIAAYLQFTYFPTDFESHECQELWSCAVSYLNLGMRNGGGIADSLREWDVLNEQSTWLTRNAYDLAFFIVINVFMLNLVFGIIIDNFADLRDQRKEQSEDRENTCYVCGVSREEFHRAHLSFDHHKSHDHNLAVYLRFIVYVLTKNKEDLTGLEDYVRDCLERDDLSWFPVQHVVKIHGRTLKEGEEDSSKKEAERVDVVSLRRRLDRIEKLLVRVGDGGGGGVVRVAGVKKKRRVNVSSRK